jgi:hypothetical protein
MPDRPWALEELIEDGFLVREGGRIRTTPRWQAAMARAALALQRSGEPWHDLRLPVTLALSHRYGVRSDEELADLVEAMLPIEEELLPPLFGDSPGVTDAR